LQVVQDLLPEGAHLLNLLAEPITEKYLEDFIKTYGDDWLAMLLDEDRAVRHFASMWRTVSSRTSW
jgi:hypothetical protein